MSEPKTKPTTASVKKFIDGIGDEQQRKDSRAVLALMKKATGEKPRMWGDAMVGFGSYHYKGASGREGDWFLAGFSPRKQSLSIYVMAGFTEYGTLMKKLGKYKTGKSCLYVKKLEDVDVKTLEELVRRSAKHVAKMHA